MVRTIAMLVGVMTCGGCVHHYHVSESLTRYTPGPPLFRTLDPRPTLKPWPLPTTVYEHRDHRELPIGTRLYFRGGREMIVRPGQPGPSGPPDVVIVP